MSTTSSVVAQTRVVTRKELSFLQTMEPAVRSPDAAVYVHPMVKRSASALSPKSLSMCTESLGSETGVGSDDDDVSSPAAPETRPAREPRRTRSRTAAPFPPPLKSAGEVRVKSHREDGRLVLRAEIVAKVEPCFRAKRTQGRLRLQLVGVEQPSREVEEEEEEEETEEVGVKVEKRKLGKYGRCTEGNKSNNTNDNDRVLWDRPYLVAT